LKTLAQTILAPLVAAVALSVSVGVAAASFSDFALSVAEDVFKPSTPFDDAEHPAAPDYGAAAAWSAFPGRVDGSDSEPDGSPRAPENAAIADVFFVPPTTFLSTSEWNGPAADRSDAMRQIDDDLLENMASAFNACCRVFSPRYRQASFYAMFTPGEDSHRAIELAYGDVRRAFRYYIAHENNGRPFILASHSQGSWHILRLIAEEIDGTALHDRFVAAYAPGYLTPADVFTRELKHTPPCVSPSATGCVLVWNTFGLDGDPRFHRMRVEHHYAAGYEAVADKATVCVNPITWSLDGAESPREGYLGVAAFGPVGELGAAFMPGSLAAQCKDGVLKIDRYGVAHVIKAWTFPENDSHPYDLSMFYLNIRANAVVRTRAWAAAHQRSASAGSQAP
jgi:hypothetical protein